MVDRVAVVVMSVSMVVRVVAQMIIVMMMVEKAGERDIVERHSVCVCVPVSI